MPELVDSVNVLILADRRITIEGISEQLEISIGIAQNIVHDDLAISKIIYHWVSPGQWNASYCSKNSGNHLSVWLGTVATSSLQSRSRIL